MKSKIKQIFHRYELWEDWLNGMWRNETKEYEAENIDSIIQFTANHIEYGKAMIRVIDEWHICCENNLSNTSINRKAWIGHAACCIAYNYPEYLVRRAWKTLTFEQQKLANNEADKAIKLWEQRIRLKPMSKSGKIDAIQLEFQMQLQ